MIKAAPKRAAFFNEGGRYNEHSAVHPPSFDPRRNPMGVRGVMYNATHREASIVMVQPSVPPSAA